MKSVAFAVTLLVGFLAPTEVNLSESGAVFAQSSVCCKTWSKGKACGDSCIARDKVCNKGKGCAFIG